MTHLIRTQYNMINSHDSYFERWLCSYLSIKFVSDVQTQFVSGIPQIIEYKAKLVLSDGSTGEIPDSSFDSPNVTKCTLKKLVGDTKIGDQYSYSNAGYPKSFNLLDKKCKDPKYPNGCTLYQRYDNTISKTAGNFTLTKGQSIAFGNNKAILQDDGNFVIYNNKGTPLIASNTVGSNTDRVIFQGDGNLVAYRGNSPVWASDTVGNPNASLVFRSDGNMTIYNQGGNVLCSTTNSPSFNRCFNRK